MIERLKNLISMFGSRNEDSVPIAAMAEAWNALPKLLDAVEAVQTYTGDEEEWMRVLDALAALETEE